jgi:hypothetical protein
VLQVLNIPAPMEFLYTAKAQDMPPVTGINLRTFEVDQTHRDGGRPNSLDITTTQGSPLFERCPTVMAT